MWGEPPTALAPTAELAEPKIKRFAKRLASDLNATIHRLYACEPCTNKVYLGPSNDAPNWIEGDWGLELRCRYFSHDDYDSLAIRASFIEARADSEHGMIVVLQLSARVMRH